MRPKFASQEEVHELKNMLFEMRLDAQAFVHAIQGLTTKIDQMDGRLENVDGRLNKHGKRSAGLKSIG